MSCAKFVQDRAVTGVIFGVASVSSVTLEGRLTDRLHRKSLKGLGARAGSGRRVEGFADLLLTTILLNPIFNFANSHSRIA
jgi:hypothetical protein